MASLLEMDIARIKMRIDFLSQACLEYRDDNAITEGLSFYLCDITFLVNWRKQNVVTKDF